MSMQIVRAREETSESKRLRGENSLGSEIVLESGVIFNCNIQLKDASLMWEKKVVEQISRGRCGMSINLELNVNKTHGRYLSHNSLIMMKLEGECRWI